MYKYAIQDSHRKQVHVSSVPRHCVPSEISTAIGDRTETRSTFSVDRVSVPSPIAIDILMVRNGEGQSSHVLVFCVNFEMLKIIPFTL